MAKLFDLTAEGRELELLIDQIESTDSGLDADSEKILYDALLQNEELISKKLEAIVILIKDAEAEAEKRKKAAAELSKSKKTQENRVDNLKRFLKVFLKMRNLTKHKAGNWEIRLHTDAAEAKLIITRKEIENGDQEALAELKPEFVQKKLVLAIDPNDQDALAKLPAEFVTTTLELDRAAVRKALESQSAKQEEELLTESADKIDFAFIAERGQHVKIA